MGWFFNLLKLNCIFCNTSLKSDFTNSWREACEYCSYELSQLTNQPIQKIEISEPGLGKLTTWSLGNYEGWLKNHILKQKKSSVNTYAVRVFAHLLVEKNRLSSEVTLVWVPSKAFSDVHLVEILCLELEKLDIRIIPIPTLLRRSFFSRPQKGLNRRERKSKETDFFLNPKTRKLFQIQSSKKLKVWLLDDVVTTGSTLLRCKKQLESAYPKQIEIVGAITLAHTPFPS